MKPSFQIVTMLLVCSVLGCISYDSPVIYHKNFQPGTHPLLQFDGWYALNQTYSIGKVVKPVFFYRDGSAWFAEREIPMENVDAGIKIAPHSWGNYKIQGDTIIAERFYKAETSDNYNRIIMTGIIQEKNIHWILREEHRLDPDTLNYDSPFDVHAMKPDSTKNWIRTRPEYNK